MASEDEAFAKRFWQYIKECGYQFYNKAKQHNHFYRFDKPENEESPWMIELFSKNLIHPKEFSDSHLTSVPLDEISSLSAILLDETYVNLIYDGKKMIKGVPVVDIPHLMIGAELSDILNERYFSSERTSCLIVFLCKKIPTGEGGDGRLF